MQGRVKFPVRQILTMKIKALRRWLWPTGKLNENVLLPCPESGRQGLSTGDSERSWGQPRLGQKQRYAGAVTLSAFHRQAPAMQFDMGAGDGKAEPHAVVPARDLGIDLAERGK